MKPSSLNEWLTLIANVGVIAGIIFLAAEISQNTNMIRSQTRDAVAEKQADYFFTIGANVETAGLLNRASNGTSDFEPEERTAFFYLTQGIFRVWENEFYQFQSGLFEEAEFAPRLNAWQRSLLNNTGRKQVWESVRDAYSPEFVELLDGLVN